MYRYESITQCFIDCDFLLSYPECVNEPERIIDALGLCCMKIGQLDTSIFGDAQSVAQEYLDSLNNVIQSIGFKGNEEDQKNRVRLILNTLELSEAKKNSIFMSIRFFAYMLSVAKSNSMLNELWFQNLKDEVVA